MYTTLHYMYTTMLVGTSQFKGLLESSMKAGATLKAGARYVKFIVVPKRVRKLPSHLRQSTSPLFYR